MANQHPNQDLQDRNVEVPGDTDAADIVDRTGEQMPKQSHDGLEADDRESGASDEDEQHERSRDNPRTGPVSDSNL